MPSNKNAAIRYRIIDRCLRNSMRAYPSKEYLRDQISSQLFGDGTEAISLSSIEKDIIAMREDAALGYFAPIRYDRARKGYYYEDPDYSIDGVALNGHEADALRSAAQTLQLFADIPLFTHLKEAIEKINTRLSLSTDIDDPAIAQHIQFEQPVSTQGREWIKPLYEAITARHAVQFTYHNIYKDETREHQLEPYLLKEVRNKWYLIGYSNKHERFITYALDRIGTLRRNGTSFQYRRDFDPEDFFRYSTGIMEVQSPGETVVLEAIGHAAKWLQLNPLHASQKIIKEGKNIVRFALEVNTNEELIQQLLGCCNAVKVVKPRKLQQRMQEEIAKAAALYSAK